jgi:hypothetical protein
MDIIATLKGQHCQLEDLFHDMSVAKGADRRSRIFEELCDTLVAHIGLEERLLRVAVGRAPRESGLLEAWEARLRVERVITMLAAMDVSSPGFDAELARIQDLFEDRVEHEELHLFPKLERYLSTRSGRSSSSTSPITAANLRAHSRAA